jgi:chromosome segregation protein
LRFTRLRLNGFKSFVDPTDLLISDGLTGVVGPNGCGKSNLLEALRWVMGENRASAMRGGGMEDVIFAGAATRPARNFAEVQLVLDNSERLAPSGFNELDQLEIVRRITRDAGSAYKANTKDVRARDIQMLFADASTGAHSPALVRQGQISELINAKPKSRRRILEEAAGISGLYQRRHEAELKLNGAEANLLRVDDIIEQLASQLAQLARQARQAARYRTIGIELRHAEGLLLYRRWSEARDARETAQTALRERTVQAAAAERAVRDAETARTAADATLPALREEDAIAAAVLQRLGVEMSALSDEDTRARTAIETLSSRIEQMGRDIAREDALNHDASDTVERLDWEQRELSKASDGHEDALDMATDAARTAAATLEGVEETLSELTEDVARLAARHQSIERQRNEAAQAFAHQRAQATRANEAVALAQAHSQDAADSAAQAIARQTEASAAAQAAEVALQQADEARNRTAALEANARAERSAAEGEAGALRAEVNALMRLVAREAGEGAQVLDQLTVDRGYEIALGAALADDLRAPAVTDDEMSGWAALPDYAHVQPLPDGVTPLRDHIQVPPVLARRMAQVGLVARKDGPRLQATLGPGQHIVSVEGDLWRWDGLRARAEDAPSAAALRLQQLNRLVMLKRDLEDSSARAAGATQAHEVLTLALATCTDADKAARQARRDADTAVAEASRALSRAEGEHSMAQTRLETAGLAVVRHTDEAESAQERLLETEADAAGLPDLSAARAGVEDAKHAVDDARRAMMAQRGAQDELRRTGEARTRRRQQITKEISGWRERLSTASSRSTELGGRMAAAQSDLAKAQAAPLEINSRRSKLATALDTATTRRQTAGDALATGETTLRTAQVTERDANAIASTLREGRAAAQARFEAADQTLTAARMRIHEDQGATPETLLQQLDADPDALPQSEAIEADILRLRRSRDALGSVNLRAEEDATEVQTEHDLLVSEKADLESAIATLRAGIAGLNKEGRERLLTAFEQVNTNFSTLFTHLFGGGEAKLVLVESDDPLEAGLEILCQPPGKKLSTLSLLSGGEQTLTALALIFAVFLANPAPICVLDEVDAPLDDANVTRFCDLLDEMTRRTDTRFLIITHHAITMSRMDRLFGVTMQEQGVSQLVSVDLKKATAMVA